MGINIMKPNIFKIATKELSQDGFFTWLLQWADSSNKIHNIELCSCAKEFVKKLICKQVSYNIEISKVKAGRQWDNIDIWAEVNDEILIIIEDKTFRLESLVNISGEDHISESQCHTKCSFFA
jgi:hypothetical protein